MQKIKFDYYLFEIISIIIQILLQSVKIKIPNQFFFTLILRKKINFRAPKIVNFFFVSFNLLMNKIQKC